MSILSIVEPGLLGWVDASVSVRDHNIAFGGKLSDEEEGLKHVRYCPACGLRFEVTPVEGAGAGITVDSGLWRSTCHGGGGAGESSNPYSCSQLQDVVRAIMSDPPNRRVN